MLMGIWEGDKKYFLREGQWQHQKEVSRRTFFFRFVIDTTCKTISSSQKCVKQHAIIIKVMTNLLKTGGESLDLVLIFFLTLVGLNF
jgi:hypothetical protein